MYWIFGGVFAFWNSWVHLMLVSAYLPSLPALCRSDGCDVNALRRTWKYVLGCFLWKDSDLFSSFCLFFCCFVSHDFVAMSSAAHCFVAQELIVCIFTQNKCLIRPIVIWLSPYSVTLVLLMTFSKWNDSCFFFFFFLLFADSFLAIAVAVILKCVYCDLLLSFFFFFFYEPCDTASSTFSWVISLGLCPDYWLHVNIVILDCNSAFQQQRLSMLRFVAKGKYEMRNVWKWILEQFRGGHAGSCLVPANVILMGRDYALQHIICD